MHFKKTVVAVLCLCICLASFVCTADVAKPTEVKAASVKDYEAKIEELEQQQKEIEKEIKELKKDKADKEEEKQLLTTRINVIQEQIRVCNEQIEKLDADVAALEKKIADKQVEMENTKFLFQQRLRAIYMSGGMTASTLSMILSAENLSDLLTKTEFTKSISAYDNALIAKLVSDMQIIENSKAEVVKLQDEQKAVKVTLEEKKAELKKDVSEINSILSDIKNDVNSLENQIDKLDKAIEEYEKAIKEAQDKYKDQYYDGVFSWPVPGHYNVTSPYGYRTLFGVKEFHRGIDIPASKNTPIYASNGGKVITATFHNSYGNYVVIDHGGGKSTLYAHANKLNCKVGDVVKQGDVIAYVGTTGNSTGNHLHFEVRIS